MRSSCRSICRELPEGLQPRDLRDFRLALPRQRLEDDDFGLVGFGAGRRGFRRTDEAVVGSRHDLRGDALRGVAYAGHAGRRPAEQFAIGRFEGPLSGIAAAQNRFFSVAFRSVFPDFRMRSAAWPQVLQSLISTSSGRFRCENY